MGATTSKQPKPSRLSRLARRPWMAAPAVVLIAGGGWFIVRNSSESEAQAETLEQVVDVTVDDMGQTVSAEGTIEAAETADLSFSSAGTVTAVDVAAGDEVSEGDVLATIDSADLEAAAAQAEATVADAEARLADDQDAGASDAQIDADESNLSTAEAQLEAAEEALDEAKLKAPFEGTVSAVNVTEDEQISDSGTSGTDITGSDSGSGQSSGTLGSGETEVPGGSTDSSSSTSAEAHVQVVSTGSYVADLSIDTTEIDLIEEGQEATITPSSSTSTQAFPGGGPGGGFGGGADTDEEGASGPEAGAGDGTATGEVTDVSNIADASSGVASYTVTVEFDGDPETFYVGATAAVEIVYDETPDVLQVPAQAVTTTDGISSVVVESEDGPRETREIETGTTSGGMVEIVRGLEEGEQVVISVTLSGAGEDAGEDGGPPGGGGGNFQPPEGFEPRGGGGFDPSGGGGFGGGGFPGGNG